MEVSVISMENIKPWSLSSSETDHHHHHHHQHDQFKPFKLCLLDQLMFSTHVPVILFYPMKDDYLHDKKAVGRRLKASLSKTLDPFYPVAGRVKDNLVIHDFQKGVPFTEARVKGHRLSDFLASPNGRGRELKLLSNLLPFEPFCLADNAGSHAQVTVQLNTFDCGGIALGLNLYHKDGATTSAFVNTWAANCSGGNPRLTKQPELHKASSLFSPRDSIPIESQTFSDRLLFEDVRRRGQMCASTRFVFDEEAVSRLRTVARASIKNPTRLEALLAFIWESALKAAGEEEEGQLMTYLMQGVNMRVLMSPRLSTRYFSQDW